MTPIIRTVRFKRVTYVELLMPGDGEKITEELRGKTIAEVARTASNRVFAIRTFQIIYGQTDVHREMVTVTSAPFGYSPLTYINGQVFSFLEIWDLPIAPEGRSALMILLTMMNCTHFILTRTGNYVPFYLEKGETNITV